MVRGWWLVASPAPPCPADHSRKNRRSSIKTNHQWTRIDTNADGTNSMNSGAQMLLQYRGLGGRISWDEGPLGARASRPHKSWHSLGHLHDLDQPGTAPWLDAVPSNRVEHRIEAQRRPSGERCRLPGSSMAKFARSARNRRGSMPADPGTRLLLFSRNKVRAGRPRSQGITPR